VNVAGLWDTVQAPLTAVVEPISMTWLALASASVDEAASFPIDTEGARLLLQVSAAG
jgi:hypothetical protein